MPEFLEKKLKDEYPDNPGAVYGTLNSIGAMRGNKTTPKGEAMQAKHDAKKDPPKAKPHTGFRSVMRASGKLSTEERKELPKSKFGLPGARAYPVSDPSHARNAKARASQQEAKGNLTSGEKAQIDRKANAVIKRAGGHPTAVKNPFSGKKKRG